MIILSIETSCDETAISLLEATGNVSNSNKAVDRINVPTFSILGNALHSQVGTHAEYGGVFPMMAKREHAKNIVPLLGSAILHAKESGKIKTNKIDLGAEKEEQIRTLLARENDLGELFVNFIRENELPQVDLIAVTNGPGLEPALWVGVSFAKAVAVALDKPIVPVNHMEGHIVSVLMAGSKQGAEVLETEQIKPIVQFPALALLISGGHTELVLAESWHSYKIIGQTVDDAIGEAFDKVARLLDLPYPGGPKISKFAAESRESKKIEKLGDEAETEIFIWTLPRPMIKSPDFNFSFSGIKTAVLYAVQKRLASTGVLHLSDEDKLSLAEEFENAVTEVLISKTRRALKETGACSLIIGGGVIANTYIRSEFEKMIAKDFTSKFSDDDSQTVQLFTPSLDLSTDNSVMIGIAGYMRYVAATEAGSEAEVVHLPSAFSKLSELKASGNLSFSEDFI